MNALVERYRDELEAFLPAGPLVLGGYSAGGLMAVALAAALEQRGRAVSRIVLLDAPVRFTGLTRWVFTALRKLLAPVLPEVPVQRPRALRILHALFKDAGLRRHLEAVAGYTASPVRAPVVLIQPRLSPFRFSGAQAHLRCIAAGGLRIVGVPGDHDSFLRGQHASALARRIADMLNDGEINGRL